MASDLACSNVVYAVPAESKSLDMCELVSCVPNWVATVAFETEERYTTVGGPDHSSKACMIDTIVHCCATVDCTSMSLYAVVILIHAVTEVAKDLVLAISFGQLVDCWGAM